MCPLKITIAPVIVRSLGMIKEGIHKHTNKMPENPSLYEIQKKIYFAVLLISLGDYYQCNRKMSPTEVAKNLNS